MNKENRATIIPLATLLLLMLLLCPGGTVAAWQVLDGDAKAIGRHNGMARKLQDTPVRSIGGRRFGHGGGTQQPLLPRRNVPAYATTGYNSDMISMAGPSG